MELEGLAPSDREDGALLAKILEHLETFGCRLLDNIEAAGACPTFYDTAPGTFLKIHPPAWLTVVSLNPTFSLEFPSVDCSSLFQLSYSKRLKCEGGNIVFHCNCCDSFKERTPRLHFQCIPCSHPSPSLDWSDICLSGTLIPFAALHQLTRQLICSDQKLSVSAWPHSIQVLDYFAQLSLGWVLSLSCLTFNSQSPSTFFFRFSAPG